MHTPTTLITKPGSDRPTNPPTAQRNEQILADRAGLGARA
jgi:hypothetical protein